MGNYITGDELQSYLGIGDDNDDTLLTAATWAAESAIDAYCGRNFLADYGASIRRFTASSPYSILVDDFYQLDSITVAGAVWSATDYVLRPANGIIGGVSGWPYNEIVAVGVRTFTGTPDAVVIEATWGWLAVPAAVKQAALIKAGRLFQRKDAVSGDGGFGTFTQGLIRVALREDPDVAALLNPYRRGDAFV